MTSQVAKNSAETPLETKTILDISLPKAEAMGKLFSNRYFDSGPEQMPYENAIDFVKNNRYNEYISILKSIKQIVSSSAKIAPAKLGFIFRRKKATISMM